MKVWAARHNGTGAISVEHITKVTYYVLFYDPKIPTRSEI